MKAIVQDRYGPPDVLELREISRPLPGYGEVLVRVRAASIHPDVWHVMAGQPYVLRVMGAGVRRPTVSVPGTDVAGTVEAIGPGVARWRPGAEVFGEIVRGHQWHNGGAFAEYAVVDAASLLPKPARLSFEEAAAVPTSGAIALRSVVHEGQVQPDDAVLVNGAGGGVGTFAVQIAVALGAEVTAVDGPGRADRLRALGATRVIDYTRNDFTYGWERWDVIVDVPATHRWSDLRHALTTRGRYIMVGHDGYGAAGPQVMGGVARAVRLMAMSPFVRQLPTPRRMPTTPQLLAELSAMLEDGRVRPIVDRTFPLAEAAQAMRYLQSGRAFGKVVLTV